MNTSTDDACEPAPNSLATKTVLVTGASGFLGSHLCDRLLSEGAEVHGVSRSERTGNTGLRWWCGTLDDPGTANRLFDEIRPDIVYHFAGQVTADPKIDNMLPAFHSLLTSTIHVLINAARSGCDRVVLSGSLTEPGMEDPQAVPSSPYAAAKFAASTYARMFYSLYDVPVLVVKPFMTYGPRQDERKIVPYATRLLDSHRAPKLSSGNWRADWIYVDDVTEGFLKAARVPILGPESIDLGTGILHSIRQVVEKIHAFTRSRAVPQFGAIPDRPQERVQVADTGFSRDRLGWEAQISLDSGLQRTVDWCRENPQESRTI